MYQLPTFVQQLEAFHQRLRNLYQQVEEPTSQPAELLPPTLLELGVAAEEFQVVTEELQQQNERMSTALATAASETRYYQRLFEQLPQPCLITNTEGKILEVNREASRLLQVGPALLVGKLLISLVPAEWRSTFRNELSQIQQSSQPHCWATCLQSRDGHCLDVAVTTSTIYSESDRTLRLSWLFCLQGQAASELHSSPAAAVERLPRFESSEELEPQKLHIYEKGETIPLSPQTIWIVRQGLVKLTTITDGSEEVLIGLAGPAMSLSIGPGSLPTYEALALSKVELVRYALREIGNSPELCQMLLIHCHHRLQQAEELLAIAGRRRVKDRLYHLLRLLKQQVGVPVPSGIRLGVRLTHEDLANACCTTRVTVTRLLGQLQQQKKLALDSKSHLILHPDL